MQKKVQLIRPPLDEWYNVDQITEFVSVPTGLCLVSSSAKDVDSEIQIIDGMNASLEEILDRIEGDVIGVTDMYSSHGNSMRILEEAKKQGSTTLIGGPNVNHIAGRILANNPFVDYVVVGDGEEAFPMLLSGDGLNGIPNLAYRANGRVVSNEKRSVPLNRLFNLNGLTTLGGIDKKKPIPISSIRGCIKALKGGRCSFCSMDSELKLMDPDLVWEQIGILYQDYGFDSFLETGDTFFVGKYPEKLLESRPGNLDGVSFGRVYASPDQINENNARVLSNLNTRYVFLGIESVDDDVLRCANKGYTRKDIEKAIESLDKHGIMLHVPFMYGLGGENPESMEESYKFAENLTRSHPSVKLLVSFAIPLPGSGLFQNVRTHEKAREEYDGDLDKDDFFNYGELVRLHLKYFTDVDFQQTLDYVNRTKNLIHMRGDVTSFHIK